MRKIASVLSAAVLTLTLCACSSGSSTSSITVAGSTTCLPIAEIAAEGFKEETGIDVLVSGLGSSAGIEAVSAGTADIASSSRGLNADEQDLGLTPIVIAHDGIAVIVNDDNPVDNLSTEQLRDIYAGKITNWKEVGGEDLKIQVINRDEASGTREAFRTIVMDGTPFDRRSAVLSGTGQVRDVVSRSRGAIGYISLGFVESLNAKTSVKAVSVNHVEASEKTVASGGYPISRDLYFFVKGTPSQQAQDYIDYVTSERWTSRFARRALFPSPTTERGVSSVEAQETPQIEQETQAPKKRELALVSRSTYLKEKALQWIFFACAFLAVVTVILIFVFTTYSALPVFTDIGLADFFSFTWAPSEGHYGIMSLLAGSGLVTVGALAMGVPLGVGTAVYLVEIASKRVRKLISPAVDLLAGIPSIIYGFFGMIIIRPFIAQLTGGLGFGALTAWFVLAIMIVPTITTLTIDALNSIPMGIREASYAMGATKWQTIYKVVLPAAKLGIVDAIVLGMGRAIGETMAVLMVVGNAPVIPDSISSPISTLTSQIALDMSYSSGLHRSALFGMGVVLFIISAALVGIVRLISKKRG